MIKGSHIAATAAAVFMLIGAVPANAASATNSQNGTDSSSAATQQPGMATGSGTPDNGTVVPNGAGTDTGGRGGGANAGTGTAPGSGLGGAGGTGSGTAK